MLNIQMDSTEGDKVIYNITLQSDEDDQAKVIDRLTWKFDCLIFNYH